MNFSVSRAIFSLLIVFVFWSSPTHSQTQNPISAGPMLGYVEMMEANIWLQTRKSETVELVYWKLSDPKIKSKSGKIVTNENHSFIAKFKLNNLDLGTEYEYEVLISGNPVRFPYQLRFKTQVLWQWRTDPPAFTFAVGSCFFLNDEPFDRPGRGYGGEYEILDEIAKKKPDLMLWIGDNVYYREPDFYSFARLDYRNRVMRELPNLQPLLAQAVHLATWDDHDYGPNDSDRTYRLRDEATELFHRYWLNPGAGTLETRGVFFRYLYNDIEFFFLDDRYHRSPNRYDGPDKAYLGKEQLRWLKESLISSAAPFKFVISGNQVLNSNSKAEAYSVTFSEEFNDFYTWLNKSRVEGVVFLSGDRHYTELLKIEREDHYPLYEFTSSPLSSGVVTDLREETNNPLRVEGTLENSSRNFGLISISGERRNRVAKLQTISNKGVLIWEREIKASDLRNRRN
jgi:alkaline phosphatase D